MWLKNLARPAHLNLEKEVALALSILKLEECSRCQNLAKNILSSLCFITFYSQMNGFFTIYKNAISRSLSQPQYGRFDHTEAEKMIAISRFRKL